MVNYGASGQEVVAQRLVSVATIAEVDALVSHIADLSRTEPVVIVTTKSGAATPLVDATALAEEIAPVSST